MVKWTLNSVLFSTLNKFNSIKIMNNDLMKQLGVFKNLVDDTHKHPSRTFIFFLIVIRVERKCTYDDLCIFLIFAWKS